MVDMMLNILKKFNVFIPSGVSASGLRVFPSFFSLVLCDIYFYVSWYAESLHRSCHHSRRLRYERACVCMLCENSKKIIDYF